VDRQHCIAGGLADLEEDQHAVVGTEQLCDQQLEKFLLDAAGIYAVLPNEMDSQRFVKVPGSLPGNLVQGILQSKTNLIVPSAGNCIDPMMHRNPGAFSCQTLRDYRCFYF
jgi:hypothetical protein